MTFAAAINWEALAWIVAAVCLVIGLWGSDGDPGDDW